MKPVELLEILHTAERLKDVTRHSYTSGGRHESVAEHSWRITLMAFLLRDEFPELDMDKVLRMCLIHDLGEEGAHLFERHRLFGRRVQRRQRSVLHVADDVIPLGRHLGFG